MTAFEVLTKLKPQNWNIPTSESGEFDIGGKTLHVGADTSVSWSYRPDRVVLTFGGTVPTLHVAPFINVPITTVEFMQEGGVFGIGRFAGIAKRMQLVEVTE